MKADYKNWVPKGMVLSFLAGAVASLALFLVFARTGLLQEGWIRTGILIVSGLLFVAFACATLWTYMMYRAFDYRGKRRMASQIIEGTADYVKMPEGGRCLDVGCGSGALTIAVAKRNPGASVLGIDRWGKEYASFSKNLCESNARAEGVSNVSFQKGDATHLDFPDGAFDALTSNYVYHNIPSRDRQALLLESLRTLKKGGCFAIHDIMSPSRYGDMEAFLEKLRGMGYEKVELIDTSRGRFMTKSEAFWMALSGSCLLTGIK